VLLVVLGAVVTVAGVSEYLTRRAIERRYQQVVDEREQIELRFRSIALTHNELKQQVAQERQRAETLAAQLAQKSQQLETAVARLNEEERTMAKLQERLSTMEQHMERLQGELALAIRRVSEEAEDGPVQLERIVVSTGGQPGLQGRVLSVHDEWKFVVMSLGWDSVKIGDAVSIFRDDELLGKARIERVQEGVSAATLFPEWEDAEIEINDIVRVL